MPSAKEHAAKNDSTRMEHKIFSFQLLEAIDTKSDSFNETACYGVVKGYASTYGNVDACNDIVLEGAFLESIQDYKNKNRLIKVYYQHNPMGMSLPVGGIKPENIDSDKVGLPVSIDINKDVQLAREVYSLTKQRVLCDMSIGYSVDDYSYNADGQRLLKKLKLWEVSIVGEPANSLAKISEVKTRDKNRFFTIDEIKNIDTKRELEDVLRESGAFSKEAAVYLASHFIEKSRRDSEPSQDKDILSSIEELKKLLIKI